MGSPTSILRPAAVIQSSAWTQCRDAPRGVGSNVVQRVSSTGEQIVPRTALRSPIHIRPRTDGLVDSFRSIHSDIHRGCVGVRRVAAWESTRRHESNVLRDRVSGCLSRTRMGSLPGWSYNREKVYEKNVGAWYVYIRRQTM